MKSEVRSPKSEIRILKQQTIYIFSIHSASRLQPWLVLPTDFGFRPSDFGFRPYLDFRAMAHPYWPQFPRLISVY